MAKPRIGEVLFSRNHGDSENENIWDDTALIKAYDEAVSSFKSKLLSENGAGTGKGKTSTATKKAASKEGAARWKSGDRCQAAWTEDGVIYDAEILWISSNKRARVRYIPYGNEEEHPLSSLLPAGFSAVPVVSYDEVEEVDDVESCVSHEASSTPEESESGLGSGLTWNQQLRATLPSNWLGANHARANTSHTTAAHHAAATASAAAPIPQMAAPGAFPSPQLSHQSAGRSRGNAAEPTSIPMTPPPIMPQLPRGVAAGDDSENTALYSMLMSWYMSGYHTGYYQAKRDSSQTTNHQNRK